MYLGPPSQTLHDGRARAAYDAGVDAAVRCIARFGLCWSEEVDACFERWHRAYSVNAQGWFAQGWGDHYSRAMDSVRDSV